MKWSLQKSGYYVWFSWYWNDHTPDKRLLRLVKSTLKSLQTTGCYSFNKGWILILTANLKWNKKDRKKAKRKKIKATEKFYIHRLYSSNFWRKKKKDSLNKMWKLRFVDKDQTRITFQYFSLGRFDQCSVWCYCLTILQQHRQVCI